MTPLDAKRRPVAVGDEVLLEDGWHAITAIEAGLRVYVKGEPQVLTVAVLANGSSWNVATRETRPKGGG